MHFFFVSSKIRKFCFSPHECSSLLSSTQIWDISYGYSAALAWEFISTPSASASASPSFLLRWLSNLWAWLWENPFPTPWLPSSSFLLTEHHCDNHLKVTFGPSSGSEGRLCLPEDAHRHIQSETVTGIAVDAHVVKRKVSPRGEGSRSKQSLLLSNDASVNASQRFNFISHKSVPPSSNCPWRRTLFRSSKNNVHNYTIKKMFAHGSAVVCKPT